ncbi:MAG TPA: threonyl-tRNA synthetase editing domain-containing protein [Candidatus Bathyarchaeia archaeon]|nr:threonyl-tRNA synthetase editing domain-containing protein [Candidatus Bathyarchaeia archaeon]
MKLSKPLKPGGCEIRLLLIHADKISYKTTQRTKVAEDIESTEDSMEDCLVVFSSVEKLDELNASGVTDAAKNSITDVLGRLKETRVMLFPFAHLTSTLSSPQIALGILQSLEASLKNDGFTVKRAPFGWNKAFDIKSKGHPLAVLSKVICPYGKMECDFLCPYCTNPIKIQDLSSPQKILPA